MSKRIYEGKTGNVFLSFAQGEDCVLQEGMISNIRSKGIKETYYLIADDNTLAGQ